jgi:uncharacterized protein YndB with AHSA1/START domain
LRAPDGTNFPNRILYREIAPFIAYRHGVDSDDDPNAFEVVNLFTPIGGNRTHLIRTSTFPSIEARNAVMKFGAVELGTQSIEKLAAHVERLST